MDPALAAGQADPETGGVQVTLKDDVNTKHPEKSDKRKAAINEIKEIVLKAMTTEDADNAILLDRLQQTFDM